MRIVPDFNWYVHNAKEIIEPAVVLIANVLFTQSWLKNANAANVQASVLVVCVQIVNVRIVFNVVAEDVKIFIKSVLDAIIQIVNARIAITDLWEIFGIKFLLNDIRCILSCLNHTQMIGE